MVFSHSEILAGTSFLVAESPLRFWPITFLKSSSVYPPMASASGPNRPSVAIICRSSSAPNREKRVSRRFCQASAIGK